MIVNPVRYGQEKEYTITAPSFTGLRNPIPTTAKAGEFISFSIDRVRPGQRTIVCGRYNETVPQEFTSGGSNVGSWYATTKFVMPAQDVTIS